MNTIATQVVLAGPLLDEIKTKLNEIKSLLFVVLLIVAVWWIVKTFLRSGALVAVVIAIVTGAVVYWGAANITTLKEKLDSELNTTSAYAFQASPKASSPTPSWPARLRS